jgi:hypothetical protein
MWMHNEELKTCTQQMNPGANYLDELITVQQNGAGVITLGDTEEAFFRTVAETKDAPGQSSALSLIQMVAGYSNYTPPHPVPDEELGARKRFEEQ